MFSKGILGVIFFAGLHSALLGQMPPPPKHYVCYRLIDSIKIDGKLNERSWETALWTDYFRDIEGQGKPIPYEQTRVKMLWDDSMFYIGAHIETKNIWATLHKHDTIVFHDNDFEIFIDPNGDNHQYAEIEFNAFGTLMDIFLDKPYRDGGHAMFGWECKGIKYAISCQGSINNPTDTDTAWNIEIGIPLKSILDLQNGPKITEAGRQWRINFSRVQWNVQIENQAHRKLREPEHNWVWSPQWAVNMHRPEYWGYLQFSKEKSGSIADPFIPDSNWNIRMQLMAVYEAEKQYYKTEHRFTKDFSKLKIPGYVVPAQFELYSDGDQFILKRTVMDKEYSIDQSGLLLAKTRE